MTDSAQALRCLRIVGARLADASSRRGRRPNRAIARRIRSLELLAAACVAEAVRSPVRAPGPPLEAASPSAPRPDAALRGAWERPER